MSTAHRIEHGSPRQNMAPMNDNRRRREESDVAPDLLVYALSALLMAVGLFLLSQ
jgi:hypothetical protein